MGAADSSKTSRALSLFFKGAVVAVALALPLLGAWTASSLAAYANGPRGLAIAAGFLGFPILPLAWEAIAEARRTKIDRVRRRFLTFGDRIWLRTFALNFIFVSLLFVLKPQSAVRALEARGDWMLDHQSAPWADHSRIWLHRVADGFDWIYRASDQNPYVHDDDGKNANHVAKDQKPPPVRRGASEEVKSADHSADADHTADGDHSADGDAGSVAEQPPETIAPHPSDDAQPWPSVNSPLPFAINLPASAEESTASVATYLREKAPDELLRARAVHDYVADRIAYDVASYLNPAQRAPQDAAAVFARKSGVCEGYARLYAAIAEEAGLQAAFVTGDAKGAGNDVDGRGHAWDAVKVGSRWYLLDATWDAGFVNGDTFTKEYTSEYLFAPAEIFGVDHFPEAANWQLRSPPITRGEFMRTPQLRPKFFANGSTLLAPDRSQITVSSSADLDVQLAKDKKMFLLASAEKDGVRTRCVVAGSPAAHVKCALPSGGTYRVLLFESPKEFATYDFVGEIVALDTR